MDASSLMFSNSGSKTVQAALELPLRRLDHNEHSPHSSKAYRHAQPSRHRDRLEFHYFSPGIYRGVRP
jgi:hypothetical protein